MYIVYIQECVGVLKHGVTTARLTLLLDTHLAAFLQLTEHDFVHLISSQI